MSRDNITKKSRSIRNDKSGVLGLPLNLLIMVVVAAVAIGIILAWLFILTPPLERIEVTPTMVNDIDTVNQSFDVTVTAYNSKGTMSGLEVTIEGAGITSKSAITDSNGTFTFTGVTPNLGPDTPSDFIVVTVSDGTNPQSQSIAVNKS